MVDKLFSPGTENQVAFDHLIYMDSAVKIIVVGDGAVGKTCLLISYATNAYPTQYVPTVFDNYGMDSIMVDGKSFSLGLFDTGGGEDYHILRPLSYPQTDVFLVCYDIENRHSFENICHTWIPELNHYCPDIPRLLVGCKRDLRYDTSRKANMVSYEEGLNLAKRVKAGFCETSALKMEGLKDCFEQAVRLTSIYAGSPAKETSFPKFERNPNFPPEMPPAEPMPRIHIEDSTFADDWLAMLRDPRFHDVTFLVEGDGQIHAHKIVLASASSFFNKVLWEYSSGPSTNEDQKTNITDGFSREDLNSGKVEGISAVYDRQDSNRTEVVVQLSPDIEAKTFVCVLEFLYSGQPRLSESKGKVPIGELKRVAELFQMPYLAMICENVMNDEDEHLNLSIATYLNHETGVKMKEMLFNKPSGQPDVVFNVEGRKLYAHQVVLSCRSRVMAAMFSGNFKEATTLSEIKISGVTEENFLALLDYLYTDHAPLEQTNDIIGLLSLADEKGIPRLANLCELYITREVVKECGEDPESADVDLIGLLNTARIYNAEQLEDWCLHFICTNYVAFSKRKDFRLLSEEDQSYVEEHRWPPLRYLQDVAHFEKKKRKGKKCLIM